MRKINYKSDFDFVLEMTDALGNPIGFPSCDFMVKIKNRSCWKDYTAWCKGGECHNCYNDGGRLHIVCDHHDLAPGRIEAEIHLLVPDSIYPDGTRLTVSPEDIGIELVKGKGDGEGTAAAEVTVPVLVVGGAGGGGGTDQSVTDATNAANAAATAANNAAGRADTAAESANTAATRANTAAGKADTAATNADTAASQATEAAGNADLSATRADGATNAANTAAANANAAAEMANEATNTATTAATNAETAATNAETAATNAETAATNAETATTNAETAATLANSAAERAERAAEAAENITVPEYELTAQDVQTISAAVQENLSDDLEGLRTDIGNLQTATQGVVKGVKVNGGTAVTPGNDGVVSLTVDVQPQADTTLDVSSDNPIANSAVASKLAEVETAIGENTEAHAALSSSIGDLQTAVANAGTVKGVKVNGGTAATPDAIGIVDITVSQSATVEVDTALDESSSNPIANSAVAGKFAELMAGMLASAECELVDEGVSIVFRNSEGAQICQCIIPVTSGEGGSSLDPVIMTSTSNPKMMALCHALGLSVSADRMTQSEAAAVHAGRTDIFNLFSPTLNTTTAAVVQSWGSEAVSFPEFRHFTGVNSAVTFEGLPLLSIQMAPNASALGNRCFVGSQLERFVCNEGLTSIGDYAFNGISTFSLMDFSTTVRNLGAGTFSDMTLNYMIIRGDVVPTAVNGTFSNVNGSPKIMYCKPGLTPKSGTGWSVLKSWSVEDIANLPAYL